MQALHTTRPALAGTTSHVTTASRTVPRELRNARLSTYEREYLDWYHGDPLKRSITKAQEHGFNNRRELMRSTQCGCFCCLRVFAPTAIITWIRDRIDDTAMCPRCGIDAVIGDASGYAITQEFLGEMRRSAFGE